jgi:PAS domain S-box-containing protein
MENLTVSQDELIRENAALRREIEHLRKEQLDLNHLSGIIFDRKRTEQNFKKINALLVNLGPSFDENINQLTRLCGELTGANCAFYHRIEEGKLQCAGEWNLLPDFCSGNNPEGQICNEVIKSGGNQVIVFNDLLNSPYAKSDPNISGHNLNTFLGKAVFSDRQITGSICALFQSHVELSLEHEQIFTIIASAIGNEESRKNAHKNLVDSEQRFHSAFLTSPDSININRLSDGLYIDVNEGFTKVTGYEREDVIGKTSFEINIWNHANDRKRLVDGLKMNGVVENLEAVFKIKNGSTKSAIMSARLFNINGEPHILSVTRDMTERNKAMQTIRKSEQKFRSVVENAFDGIYLLSGSRFTYTNHRFCEILGYSAEEVSSEEFNFGTTLTDKSRDLIEERRKARISGEEIPGIYEFEIESKSGEIKEVEVSTVKLDHQDEVTILGIMRDITERKKLFEELVKARDKAEAVNVLKSRLLANLSHEIRTPLNGILGFAELLREEINDQSQRSMADIIYTSGYRLLHTLNAILDLSVIESQFSKTNIRTVNINQLAKEVTVLFKPTSEKKGIPISFSADPGPISVSADDELVSKVLNNLINNAIKFTIQGSILVSTTIEENDHGQFGCVHVADTGIGIKPEYQSIIFDEFRQVSEGQTRSYDGSGLGLHISKRFAEMMGGTLSVKSKFEEGSTFTLRLPIKQKQKV